MADQSCRDLGTNTFGSLPSACRDVGGDPFGSLPASCRDIGIDTFGTLPASLRDSQYFEGGGYFEPGYMQGTWRRS